LAECSGVYCAFCAGVVALEAGGWGEYRVAEGRAEAADKRVVAWMGQYALYFCVVWAWAREQRVDSSGDSYSTVGYDVTGEVPNELHPHGNPYPSFTTANGPCWVVSEPAKLILGGISQYRIQSIDHLGS